jgi:triosephosphate isomerase
MTKKTKNKEKLVIANWKMNPNSLKEAKKTFSTFKRQKTVMKNITTVFCPPFQYLYELKKSNRNVKIYFGAQDIFYKKEGAYTGEISGPMLKDLGAHFVIVGHSEKRELGETDEMISKKVLSALKQDFHVILCVGERERDFEGNYLKELSLQIKNSLEGVPSTLTKKLVIVYEPVWAIGKGNKAMDPEEMHFLSLFIRKQLIKIFNRRVAKDATILYGGSVDSENAAEFSSQEGCDGLLVGRNSLNPFELSKIVTNVSKTI